MIVSAPASSANLGPGFDALAIAVDLPFRLAVDDSAPDGFHSAEPTHPAAVAFRAAGGDPADALRWHSPIPPGRGLGFSGAARVAGAYLGARRSGIAHDDARERATEIATELEGHAENAAASACGGFVVAAAGRVVRLDLPDDVQLVVWSPSATTSTDASRRSLPTRVSLDDAAFSVGRAALWVAAVAAGDLGVLRDACEDRLHQDLRLQARPATAGVRRELLDRSDVLAAWLSGSGPSVAALVPRDVASIVAASLPGGGTVRELDIAVVGVTATDSAILD